jgi:hypothetical protein
MTLTGAYIKHNDKIYNVIKKYGNHLYLARDNDGKFYYLLDISDYSEIVNKRKDENPVRHIVVVTKNSKGKKIIFESILLNYDFNIPVNYLENKTNICNNLNYFNLIMDNNEVVNIGNIFFLDLNNRRLFYRNNELEQKLRILKLM